MANQTTHALSMTTSFGLSIICPYWSLMAILGTLFSVMTKVAKMIEATEKFLMI